jgi:hypothetical protein
VTTRAELLNARYVAIRTAEATGLTDRLLEAARDKDPAVRRMLVPMVFRFWNRDRARGWVVVEQIARNGVRFGGVPDPAAIGVFGALSAAIMNRSRQEPDDLARLGAIWRELIDRLLGSPLGRSARLVGRGVLLRRLVAPLDERLRNQPDYQPLNYPEIVASFDRPPEFRTSWARVRECLRAPDTGPSEIVDVLAEPELPFDLYLMFVCERALILWGVHNAPDAVMDTVEQLFRNGASWFRQSLLYVLLHVLSAWESVPDDVLDRYEALTIEFYRSGDWQFESSVRRYVFANQLGNVDAVAAQRGRTPHVVGELLDAAIADSDAVATDALFDAIDSIAFNHANGALALTMLERAYILGGATVEKRVLAGLASVRLQDQPLVDAFLQQSISFANIRPDRVATTEPSVGDEDFNSLVDKFFIQTMLSNNDFRMQLCRVLDEAAKVNSAEKFLVLIIEWIRDEVRGLAAHGR